MELQIFENLSTLHRHVADLLYTEFVNSPDGLHIIPTGKTFVTPYKLLRTRLLKNLTLKSAIDFSSLKLISVDEYIHDWKVLSSDDNRSFRSYLRPLVQVLMKLGFVSSNHYFPDTPYGFDYKFSQYELLTRFDELILSLGSSTSMFLGIGPPNSPHIAFCSPGYATQIGHSWEDIGAYITPVDTATKIANQNDGGIYSGNVPEYAATISAATLLGLRPKNVYLVAYGNKNLRPLLTKDSTDQIDVNAFPPAILFLLRAQGSRVHIVTDRATWINATQ